MKYSPPINKKQIYTSIISFVAAFLVLAAFSFTQEGLSSHLLKILSLSMLFISTIVLTRYYCYTYTYILEDFEFTVIKHFYGKSSVEARLFYSDITDIKSKSDVKKYDKTTKKHNYCQSLYSKNTYILFFECGQGEELLKIECDKYFAKAIEKRIKSDIIL